MINNNFDKNCKVCSNTIISGQERYVCSECIDLTICLECYPKSHSISVHTDTAPLPHYCTIEKYVNQEYFLRHRADTLFQTSLNVFETFKNRLCLGHLDAKSPMKSSEMKIKWLTYQDVYESATKFGTSLLKIVPQETFIGIFLPNIPEWYFTDLACLWYGMVTVPFHYQSNQEILYSVLKSSDTTVMVVDRNSFKNIVELIESKDDVNIQLIIHVDDDFDQELRNKLPSNVIFKLFSEMLSVAEITPPSKGKLDIISLSYSSGSTGLPKGVISSNRDFLGFINERFLPYPRVEISFLTLAHIQRKFDYNNLMFGGRIGMYSGDFDYLFDFVKAIRPQYFSAVPRVFKVIYSNYESTLKSYISDHTELSLEHCTSNVIDQFKTILGDRISNIVYFSANQPKVVTDFLKECWKGIGIYNLYGSTETMAIALNERVVANTEYRLESVPELGFTINDKPYPRGELVVCSNKVSVGYYKDKAATDLVFKDGWYYTGDIVEEYAPRSVRVIDRKKNSFKLMNGEFVSTEVIELLYLNSPLIKNIYVYGDLSQSFLVAIVIPSQFALDKINSNDNNFKDNNQLKRLILDDFERISQLNKSSNYEIPKIITLDHTNWNIDNKLLTPTGKPSRPHLDKYYKEDIESMYNTLNSIQDGLSSESNDKTNLLFNYLKSVLGLDLDNISDMDLSKLSFSQIGGDSIGAVKLSNLLKDKAKIDVKPQQILDKNVNLIDIFKNIIKNNEINWEDEMKLDDSIQINGKSMKSSGFNNIFLTGATGFNGSFLLYDLIRNQNISKVFCLIRSSGSQSDARSKLVEIIRLKNNMMIKENEISKIYPIIGDLELPLFGLNINEFIDLSNQTDLIIHNGAYVHLMNPYSNMKMANVKGTEEVLRLSTIGDHIIPVSHISTIGTFHQFNQEIDDTKQPSLNNLNSMSGYSQSKLIAEQLIHKAYQRGFPIIIFRPGVIYSHTETGVDNSNDFIRLVLSGILHLGYYPDLSNEKVNLLNLSPVDWVSSSIINISLNRSWNDADNNDMTPTFLLTNQKSITFNDFCLSMNKVYPIEMISLPRWTELLLAQTNNPLQPMFNAFNKMIPTLSQYPIDNNNTTNTILECHGYSCPYINESIIHKNIQHILKCEQH